MHYETSIPLMNYGNYSTAAGLAGEQGIEDFEVEEWITSSNGIISGFRKISNGKATDSLDDVELTMILSSMFKCH
jgi:hypothetical protein